MTSSKTGSLTTDNINTGTSGGAARRNRYGRSSTISVTQMLTDSCNSLLQRLTTRVRGPSAAAETSAAPLTTTTCTSSSIGTRTRAQEILTTTTTTSSTSTTTTTSSINNSESLLGSTRSRLEDKYSAVLEKLAGKRREPESSTSTSTARTLAKSATSVALGGDNKAYPQLTGVVREKTPYRSHPHHHHYHHSHSHNQSHNPNHQHHSSNHSYGDSYDYLDRHSAYRTRHKSNNSERSHRSTRPMRTGKSETGDHRRNSTTNLTKLTAVEIPANILEEPTSKRSTIVLRDDETPTNYVAPAPPPVEEDFVDPLIAEREAKRKEIQSLIMKYSALDEAYNRATNSNAVQAASAAAVPQTSTSTSVISPTVAIAQKYHQILPSAVALTVSRLAMLAAPLAFALCAMSVDFKS